MRAEMNNIATMVVRGGKAFGRYSLGLAMALSVFCSPALVAQAATIESLQLLSDDVGESLRITMDEAAEYQVFNLAAPSRLVVSFPNASMAAAVSALPGGKRIENIVPVQDSHGVRIEVVLASGTEYEIIEKGNDLLVKFSGKPVASNTNAGAVLQDIEVRDQGGVTELILRGQNMDANHNALVTNDGATMVLDFWGGKSKLPKEYYEYSAQRLNHVAIGSAEGRLRLVLALRNGAGTHQQIDASANEMVVRFGKIKAKPRAGALMVEAVDFQPDDRIAHLVIRTDGTSPIVNLQEKDGKVIIDLKQAQLADGQERTQDVRAFPGPVKQIDSYGLNKDVRIVARLRQKSVVTSYQTGNVLTVTIKPADMVEAAQADDNVVRDERIYKGQKVTFNYKDIDIRNALKLIAEMSELNIIMSDDVSGVLTMRLVDVPWDQALDIILAAKGLGKEKNGNVIRIAPLTVLKADADARKDAKKSAEQIAPLETEFIQLGYASVNDVRVILEGGSVKKNIAGGTVGNQAAGGQSSSNSSSTSSQSSGELKLLSDRGIIMLDERSNTMIITDTRERLNNIKRLIAVIDKPAQQVLVEARIVEASDAFSRDLGVKWGGGFNATGNRFTHGIGSPGNPVGAVGNNIVDLGAAVGAGAGGAIGYTLGTLSGALNLNLELSAAEIEGDIKVVSSPRVFTSNLQEAIIEQDKQIPFSVVTASIPPVISTKMVSAKLTLKVTPQITADNRIIMQLEVNKDTPIANPTPGGDPTIDKKRVITKLLVKNGETVVLGGIYTQTISHTVNSVPGLSAIPILGNLFKRNQKTNNRSELLIFITPTIIDGAVKLR